MVSHRVTYYRYTPLKPLRRRLKKARHSQGGTWGRFGSGRIPADTSDDYREDVGVGVVECQLHRAQLYRATYSSGAERRYHCAKPPESWLWRASLTTRERFVIDAVSCLCRCLVVSSRFISELLSVVFDTSILRNLATCRSPAISSINRSLVSSCLMECSNPTSPHMTSSHDLISRDPNSPAPWVVAATAVGIDGRVWTIFISGTPTLMTANCCTLWLLLLPFCVCSCVLSTVLINGRRRVVRCSRGCDQSQRTRFRRN